MYILILAILGTVMATCVEAEPITIGYLSSMDKTKHLEGPAITIAIETFLANGWLQDHEFK